MRSLFEFKCEKRGNVAMITALALMSIVGISSIALDYHLAVKSRYNMQDALDSAVLGALLKPQSEREAEATRIFRSNLPSEYQTLTPSYVGDLTNLKASINIDAPTTMLSLMGVDSIPIGVDASAKGNESVGPCILLLDPTILAFAVNGSNVSAPGCAVHVKSKAFSGGTFNSSTVNFKQACFEASAITVNSSTVNNVRTNCKTADDVYAGTLPVPSNATCDFNAAVHNAAPVTLNPGVYCGTRIFNASNATLNPGLYVLKNANWIFNAASLKGSGVTIYFSDSSSTAAFNAALGVMTPPTSGPYKGLLIYEAIGLPSKAMAFNASPASAWSGLIYLPSRNMTMNAQSLSVNNKLTMVFNRLTLNSSDWTLDFDMDNKLKSYSLENIRLTQ